MNPVMRGLQAARIAGAPAIFDADITAVDPSERSERLPECCGAVSVSRIAFRLTHQHSDEPDAWFVLRARRDRPHYRTADQRDELATPHSITSSAMASSEGGTSMPNTFAVLRLITNSNLVGRSTGSSSGLAP